MTKPLTSVALMTLWEQGCFTLDDPVHRYLPEWRDLRVRSGGSWPAFETRAAQRPMRVRDLLAHTSGLTYDFLRATNLDAAYRELGVGRPAPGYTLEDMARQLAALPLEFSPGERWNYSLATDVLGLLIQRISGQPFEVYLRRTLFEPLAMSDTVFSPRDDQLPRFAACYARDSDKRLVVQDDPQCSEYRQRSFHSGGGGLLSTASDYLRFCRMLAHGGTLDGRRIIGRKTLELMVANHLPAAQDLARLAVSGFSETHHEGVGFNFRGQLEALVYAALD